MDQYTKNIIDVFTAIATLCLGLFIYLKGIKEYKKANKTKRAEFLEKLIESFNAKTLQIAKDIIDDFVYPQDTKYTSKTYYSLQCVNLVETLRNHSDTDEGIIDPIERQIRNSFTNLLDFFFKLSYYYSNKLITKDELLYFKYYLDRIDYTNPDTTSSEPERERLRKEGIEIFVNNYFNPKDFERLFIAIK